MNTQLLKFCLTWPDNTWLEAIVVDDIHTFPKLELNDKIIQTYEMNVPFPQPEGEVDISLRVVDSLKLLKNKHIFLTKSFELLSTVYAYAPSRSQPVENLINSGNVSTLPSNSYLASTEALTKAMEKMWEMDRLPMDDSPSSLTKDELIAVSKIKDTITLHKGLERFVTRLLWRDGPDLITILSVYVPGWMRYFKGWVAIQSLGTPITRLWNLNVTKRVVDPAAADLSRTDVYYPPHRNVIIFYIINIAFVLLCFIMLFIFYYCVVF